MEEWKSCIEDYEISNFGNCRRKKKNGDYTSLEGSISNRGYRYFQLNREGKRINNLFHQLVARYFIGDRPDNLVIDHIDRNKLNNNVSNLRYITQAGNCFNKEGVVNDIPFDTPNRHSLVCKLWREKNIEKLKEQKKIYYNNNKQVLLEKQKNNKVEVVCSECNEPRTITKNCYNRNKRLGVNTCKKCANVKVT